MDVGSGEDLFSINTLFYEDLRKTLQGCEILKYVLSFHLSSLDGTITDRIIMMLCWRRLWETTTSFIMCPVRERQKSELEKLQAWKQRKLVAVNWAEGFVLLFLLRQTASAQTWADYVISAASALCKLLTQSTYKIKTSWRGRWCLKLRTDLIVYFEHRAD